MTVLFLQLSLSNFCENTFLYEHEAEKRQKFKNILRKCCTLAVLHKFMKLLQQAELNVVLKRLTICNTCTWSWTIHLFKTWYVYFTLVFR